MEWSVVAVGFSGAAVGHRNYFSQIESLDDRVLLLCTVQQLVQFNFCGYPPSPRVTREEARARPGRSPMTRGRRRSGPLHAAAAADSHALHLVIGLRAARPVARQVQHA